MHGTLRTGPDPQQPGPPASAETPVSPRRAAFRAAVALAAIVAVHVALVFDRLPLAVGVILVACLFGFIEAIRRRLPLPVIAGLGATALLFGAALGLSLAGYAPAASLLAAPPFLALMSMAALFGRTLLPGQVPVITRFMHLELGDVPAPIAETGRRLTAMWTALFAGMALSSLALMALTDISTWSWFVNVVNPAVMTLFFLGQHVHSRTYLPKGRRPSPRTTVRRMLKPELWMG